MSNKVTRLIINGVPYKLVKVEGVKIDDYCELCVLKELCQRNDTGEDVIGFCSLNGDYKDYMVFAVDTDIDKTIKEALNDEY